MSGCWLSTLLLQSTAKNSPERHQIWCNFVKQCATSPHLGGTGTIMMNSSGIFVKATHKRTLGEWYIGSYGIARWLFVPNLDILQPTNPTRGSGENNQWSEGCVSRSMPVVPVWAADMTINAPNVVVDKWCIKNINTSLRKYPIFFNISPIVQISGAECTTFSWIEYRRTSWSRYCGRPTRFANTIKWRYDETWSDSTG